MAASTTKPPVPAKPQDWCLRVGSLSRVSTGQAQRVSRLAWPSALGRHSSGGGLSGLPSASIGFVAASMQADTCRAVRPRRKVVMLPCNPAPRAEGPRRSDRQLRRLLHRAHRGTHVDAAGFEEGQHALPTTIGLLLHGDSSLSIRGSRGRSSATLPARSLCASGLRPRAVRRSGLVVAVEKLWGRIETVGPRAKLDLGDVLAVLRVEMRRRMIRPVHPDDDSVERCEARHCSICRTWSGGSGNVPAHRRRPRDAAPRPWCPSHATAFQRREREHPRQSSVPAEFKNRNGDLAVTNLTQKSLVAGLLGA
jgi:hypothetical protein